MWGNISPPSLNSALAGDKRLDSRPGRFTPKVIGTGTRLKEAVWAPEPTWALWRRHNVLPLPGIESRSPSPWPRDYKFAIILQNPFSINMYQESPKCYKYSALCL
jgi:hypothetical protein